MAGDLFNALDAQRQEDPEIARLRQAQMANAGQPEQPAYRQDVSYAKTPPPPTGSGPVMTAGPMVSSTVAPASPAPTGTMAAVGATFNNGAAPGETDPFAANGGGVKIDGNWYPKDHPGAIEWMKTHPQGNAAPGTAPQTPGTPGAGSSPADIAAAASTVSATPGAAPTGPTTNQGTQDVVRNSWLQKATQSTTVDPNDPNIKQQVDPFAAAQERARRQYESEAAERLSAKGLADSGQMTNERRYAAERSGQATGMFRSQLVGQELQAKRAEIADALKNLGDTIGKDQQLMLQEKLGTLDAAIKREGIASGERTANREIDVKDKLGTGALNVDLSKALLGNDQFNTGQALDWSKFDWMTNPMNPANY
jgi:hypothetical protein